MKVIILEGWNGRGKTTTLQMVFATLLTNNWTVNNFALIHPSRKIKDFEAILSLDSKTVAIFSEGDNQGHCKAAIVKYANCDVLILAHTSRLNALQIPSRHTSLLIQKTVANATNSEVQANAQDCQNIVNNI